MKTIIVFFLTLIFGNQLFAQVNNTYAFAVGTPDGVTIRWDALSAQTEVEGCYLYKKETYSHIHEVELLTIEMLVSPDGIYTFIDNGTFDSLYPPIYSIHIQTADSTYIIEKVFGFKDFSVEKINDNLFEMRLIGWNNTQCCSYVKVWIDGIFVADAVYDTAFSYTYDLTLFAGPPYEIDLYVVFEDNSMFFGYAEFKFTGADLFYLSNFLGVPDFEANNRKFNMYPNPATTKVSLQLPENILPSSAIIELFNTSGQKLMRFTPNTRTPLIETGNLPAGMYLVRLYDGKQWHGQKLMVKH